MRLGIPYQSQAACCVTLNPAAQGHPGCREGEQSATEESLGLSLFLQLSPGTLWLPSVTCNIKEVPINLGFGFIPQAQTEVLKY